MADQTPQLEDGYLRIANKLYEEIIKFPFSKRELLVVLAVIRKTYGYGKKVDDMTMTQLAELTGLQRTHVGETVSDLKSMNVLLIRDGNYGKVIGLSKNYNNWKKRPKTVHRSKTVQRTETVHPRPKTVTSPSQNGTQTVPKQYTGRTETGHTKDNSKRQLQKTTPKDSCSGAKAPTADTWDAYAQAYQERYHVPPVRNAKVNGQIASFIKRVSAKEAPYIASYYVRSNNSFYNLRGHSVDLLLKDAEKLRTEWVTNRQITGTEARRKDRNQAEGDDWNDLLRTGN